MGPWPSLGDTQVPKGERITAKGSNLNFGGSLDLIHEENEYVEDQDHQ